MTLPYICCCKRGHLDLGRKLVALSYSQSVRVTALPRNLDEILEPLFWDGLQNYSSLENRQIIKDIVEKFQVEPNSVKRWIDHRKRREKRKQMQPSTKTLLQSLDPADNKEIAKPNEVTALKLDRWKYYLKDCPHPDAKWVLDGIQNGFSINCYPTSLKSVKQNFPSARLHSNVVASYLAHEIESGTMSGPYFKLPYTDAHVNRIGVIPKASGGWRMITDLSYPEGASVNDGISNDDAKVSYTGLTVAIPRIVHLGRGCLLSKFDLKNAYRLLAVKESDRHLLLTYWNDLYFVDLALPFGLRSAPQIFSRFADVLKWIIEKHANIRDLQNSLDDFLICEALNTERQSGDALQRAFELCNDLGIDIAHEKTQGPSSQITYLGFVVDSDRMEIRIPDEKLDQIKILLDSMIDKKTCTKRSLLSLIGSLYYCSTAVLHGRPLMHELVKKAHSVQHLNQRVRLGECERDIIREWYYLLNMWNGRNLLSNYSKNEIVTKFNT